MLLGIVNISNAQEKDGGVGIGTTTPDLKSILDIVSTKKGILIPRLTTEGRETLQKSGTNNIVINGMLIFNIDTQKFNYWSIDHWVDLSSGGSGSLGPEIIVKEGIPTQPIGKNGDLYIDSITGNYYLKIGDKWIYEGNLKGPQGIPGT
ncbi:hypothetical protein LY11_02245, partial [Pedobacter cryoconitis]